jgi:hypothetical protein
MSQTQEQKTVQQTIARSEELLDTIGQNIGSFAAHSWQRIQQTATRVGRGTEPTVQPRATQGEQPKPPQGMRPGGLPQAEMQRAEGLIDETGQRLSLLASMAGLQVQKMAAYTREGFEDILAEAQHIRSARVATGHTPTTPHTQPQG